MSLQVPALSDQDAAKAVEVSAAVFDQQFNETLVHQLVTKYFAEARSGTKAQKNRSAVSGGGAKPFKQKGSGRARAGTIRSPLWRTGGVTFAAQPRSYTQKLNKKMYRAGIRSIFSELLRQERLVVSQDILPSTAKTKELFSKIKTVGVKRVLIIVTEIDDNLRLASRNIPYLSVSAVESLDPVSLVAADKVIVTQDALKKIEERLS